MPTLTAGAWLNEARQALIDFVDDAHERQQKMRQGPKLNQYANEMTLHPETEYTRNGTTFIRVTDGKGRPAVFPKAWLAKEFQKNDYNAPVEPPVGTTILVGRMVFKRFGDKWYMPGSDQGFTFEQATKSYIGPDAPTFEVLVPARKS